MLKISDFSKLSHLTIKALRFYGPALDQYGNSVAAVKAMEHISHRLGLHVFEYEK